MTEAEKIKILEDHLRDIWQFGRVDRLPPIALANLAKVGLDKANEVDPEK